jgi:hypothetical protein
MPSFGYTIQMEQVRMIEAYVLSRAAAGAGVAGRPYGHSGAGASVIAG